MTRFGQLTILQPYKQAQQIRSFKFTNIFIVKLMVTNDNIVMIFIKFLFDN